MAADTVQEDQPQKSYIYLLPLIIFGVLLVLLWFGLGGFSKEGRNPSELNWVLKGKPAPTLSLAPLPGLQSASGQPIPGLDSASFKGRITILNVWGSWCVPCRDEHPGLMQLAQIAKQKNVRLVSINYKDTPAENALAFLQELGNPFEAVGVDPKGRAGIEFGVYGVPETYIIGPDGIFFDRKVGPLSPANFDAFIALIDAAIAKYPEAVARIIETPQGKFRITGGTKF